MPKCLSREEIYDIIQRELPEGVYATTKRPEEFFTTADDDAFAKTLDSVYFNACRVYENYFPQTAEEFIGKHEIKVFGEIGDAASGLAERRDRVLTQLRSRKGIKPVDILELVQLVIGSDKIIEIIEGASSDGSWILNESLLDQSTILSAFSGLDSNLSGPDIFDKTAAELGLTQEELDQYQEEAYSYTIRIIGYEATEAELAEIERLLELYEPARSVHTIVNNASSEEGQLLWLLSDSLLNENTFL